MPLQHLGASLHSHIRIVPRSKIETEYEEDDVPTWRSPSLQAPVSEQESRKGSVQSENSTSNTTFAQMARRSGKTDLESVEKTASNGLGTLSNMLKLQSKRNWKGNKSWRSLEPTHLSTDEDFSLTDNDDSSSPADLFDRNYLESDGTSSVAQENLPKASPFNLPKIQTKAIGSEAAVPVEVSILNPLTTTCDDSDDISPMDTWPHQVEDYMRVFGRLPDIIRLHEKTGDFEGELMFIGHPNRDVSAHQWLESSYQWMNIGTFSEKRKRIEGSLATDRLLNTELKYNTLEYFKEVAENREKKAKERGGIIEGLAPLGVSSGSSATRPDGSRGTSGAGVQTANGLETITSKQLEDPFVSKSEAPRSAASPSFKFRGPDSTVPGSMDFGYEFPRKPPSMSSERHHMYIERERERLQHLRVDSPDLRQTPAHLREVEFGEAAMSEIAMSEATSEADRAEEDAAAFTPPIFRMDYNQFNYVPPSNKYSNRTQFDNSLSVPGETTHRSSIHVEQRVALPDFSANKLESKNANTAGRTVANPYRVPSTLNAAAPPYQMPGLIQPTDLDLSAATLNVQASKPNPPLRSSNLDALRHEKPYPVADELNQKAPTKQNFRGPFFAQSMPTAYDPTASLAVQMSDSEKIVSWYRDGQNVNRQRDYAKTLITAASSSKARDPGLIGQGAAKTQGVSKYQNTHFFARVYENLYQYAEESRAGSWSVFTRKFKAPLLQYRDLSANGNNSFYTERAFMSPVAMDPSSWTHQSLSGSGSPWAGSGPNNNPYAPAWRVNAPPGAYVSAGSGRF